MSCWESDKVELKEYKCEIQVRNVLQDAWALISHHLVYKNESAIPPRIKRDLNNVASLLEIAQGVFDSARDRRKAYVGEIRRREGDPSEFLAQPVDHDTLLAYAQWKFPQLPVSEFWHNRLLRDLDLTKYGTLKEIDGIIEAAKPAVEAYRQKHPEWFRYSTDFLTKSFGFLDEHFRSCHDFNEPTRDAFRRYEQLVQKM